MKKTVKKQKKNKTIKTLGKIIYILFFILVVLMLIVVILQRTTNNSVSLGGFRLFTIATGSMEPEYNVGDVLIAKEIAPEEIKVGDNIAYRGEVKALKGKVITHQVIAIKKEEDGKYRLITKGISNTEEDPEISEEQVYGKIIYKVKTLSYIGKLISNIYVFYFFIFIPIALIIFRQIKNIAVGGDDDEDDR